MKTSEMKFLFSDRSDRADDPAEFLYKWVRQNHPEIECKYLIKSKCQDWPRLKAAGFNLVDFGNKAETAKAIKWCTHMLFSQFTPGIIGHYDKYNIFLQHGIIYQDLSGYLNPHVNHFDIMCVTTRHERDWVLKTISNLSSSQLALTGLARHDALINKKHLALKPKNITFQPHWRWYMGRNIETMKQSRFFIGWMSLMNSPKLKAIADKYGYSLSFRIHPTCRWCADLFKQSLPKYVKFIDPNSNFQDTFLKSSAYITDYSSNSFEVATIDIPCIYYQPDDDEVKQHNRSKEEVIEYDFEHDGIGPVTHSIDAFCQELSTLLSNNCSLSAKYIARRNDQFIYKNDAHNCERIFNAVLKLTDSKKDFSNKKVIKEKYVQKTFMGGGYFGL